MSKQSLGTASPFFNPLLAGFCERAIAGQYVPPLGLRDVGEFLTRHVRSVKLDFFTAHSGPPNLQISAFLAMTNLDDADNKIHVGDRIDDPIRSLADAILILVTGKFFTSVKSRIGGKILNALDDAETIFLES